MLFPFRTSAIFRNRWVALMWAASICFMASEIVDSVSGVTDKSGQQASAAPKQDPNVERRSADPVATVLDAPPPTRPEDPVL